MMSQQFRISQRLQWAAGANSALNAVVDEFQRATNRRTQALLVWWILFHCYCMLTINHVLSLAFSQQSLEVYKAILVILTIKCTLLPRLCACLCLPV